ncbi:hypothetical protein, partial [Streptococcus pneumoniae]|uniref:hypothetical protein n=1 Tax=Streptococcus pneumoniae TaxID=1313 RepID=UPI00307DA301
GEKVDQELNTICNPNPKPKETFERGHFITKYDYYYLNFSHVRKMIRRLGKRLRDLHVKDVYIAHWAYGQALMAEVLEEE